MGETADTTMLDLTAHIVAAHVENNEVAAELLPGLIRSVYRSLARAAAPEVKATDAPVPAVPIKRSVFPDYIVCLEDGKKLKMLKRHLKTAYDLSPADYRSHARRWTASARCIGSRTPSAASRLTSALQFASPIRHR